MSKRIKLRRSQNHITWGKLLQSYSKRTDPEARRFFSSLVKEALKIPFPENRILWLKDCAWCSVELPGRLIADNLPAAIFESDCWEEEKISYTMLMDGTIIQPDAAIRQTKDAKFLTSKIKAILNKHSSFSRAKNV